jgi:DtxR family Mn-dependent transcriptional regulator
MVEPQVEELLERLYLVQVEGDPAGPPPDEALVSLAESAGLVHRTDTGLALTEAGRAAAVSVVRRHRLAECLLVNVLAVGGHQADSDACRFEHIIEPALESKMCSLLGHPTACPHGRPIPPGPCCDPAHRPPAPEVTALAEGAVGTEGTVVFLSARNQGEVAKLMAMGILPGEPIRLLRRFPSYVFQVGLTQFTVDRQLAERIQVRWQPSAPSRPARVSPRRHRRGHGHGR